MNTKLDQFESALFKESQEAFLDIIEKFGNEEIYSMCLFNSGDSWNYILPSFATKAGLRQVASKYKESEYYQEKSIETLERDLKWNPCDSPRHEMYVNALSKSEGYLRKVVLIMNEYWDDGREREYWRIHEKLVSICINCLQKLENDDVFIKLKRQSFVLNLLNGDQTEEERLERAEQLNPIDVFLQYKIEL